jgi:hypothetical protein
METMPEATNIPGATNLSLYKRDDGEHLASLIKSKTNKKTILLASNILNDNTIFINGLGQNIAIFYHLFESLGHTCYFVQYNGAPSKALEYYNVITPDIIIRQNIHIDLYIEIGMSLDPTTRSYLRSIGAKIVKIYLGNILNIDIESVQSFTNLFFNHHLVGEVDDIWMSPHYLQNLEYGLAVNGVDISKGKIVPYVWEPIFINHGLVNNKELNWIPPNDWRTTDIIIMDPNISFQKASFYSLLLVNAFAKRCREWKGNVIVINGDKLDINSNVKNSIIPRLINLKDRIKLFGRKGIQDVMREYPSGCFITNQWTNPFNYMTFELMYNGFPIIHNSDGWEAFGYYYSLNKWDDAISTLENAIKSHCNNMPIYKSHCARLLWKHSIYNPEIQSTWEGIIQTS